MNYRDDNSPIREQAIKLKEESTTIVDTAPPAPNGDVRRPRRERTTLIIAFIIAIIACGVGYYFYHNAQMREELEAYEFAVKSEDLIVLQDYLDHFRDAPMTRRDSIHVHLTVIQQIDNEQADAWMSNSKTTLEDYLDKHPDSEHRAEVMRKIDPLDWMVTSSADSMDAYQFYLGDHPNGAYVDDIRDDIKTINAQTVQPEERIVLSSLFKQFFQSIDTKSEDGLTSTVSPVIGSSLGKVDANKSDIITFLHKLHSQEVISMSRHLLNDYEVDKREIGDEQYEYTVNFPADQDVNKVDDMQQIMHYHIRTKVNPDRKIAEFSTTRIIQQCFERQLD